MNGIPSEFYKKNRTKDSPILSEIYNNVYIREELIPSMQNGTIRLLYKKDDPSILKNWHPISLLDIDYKILTKHFGLILKDVMEKLLNPLQSTGVNRNILNNILNLETLIQYEEQMI